MPPSFVHHKSTPKSSRSPFLVDLVAETERIDEENKVRFREITRKRRAAETRRERAKHDLIFRALREEDELDTLRTEKRQILDEEKRLRALIELEKTNAHRKDDRQAAVRAEKRRHAAKVEVRRRENMAELAVREATRMKKLAIKHNLTPRKGPGGGSGHPKPRPNPSPAK